MPATLLNLLPLSPDTHLPAHIKHTDALNLLQFTLRYLQKALQTFYIQQQYNAFDPHVGETCCQIRAYQVWLLAQKKTSVTELEMIQQKILHLEKLYQRTAEDTSYYQSGKHRRQAKSDEPETLQKFFSEKGYQCCLSETELFLTFAFILTRYKTSLPDGNPVIDLESLIHSLSITKNAAKKLVRFYQVKLAQFSCHFIEQLQQELFPSCSISTQILKTLCREDDDGRPVLPCYVVMNLMLEHMQRTSCPLYFSIERHYNGSIQDHIKFATQWHNGQLIRAKTHLWHPYPIYMIEGRVEYGAEGFESASAYLARFLQIGAKSAIIASMAIHPQYSGLRLQPYSANPFVDLPELADTELSTIVQEFLQWRMAASAFGLGAAKPTLLYIVHIYCSIREGIDFGSFFGKPVCTEEKLKTNYTILSNS